MLFKAMLSMFTTPTTRGVRNARRRLRAGTRPIQTAFFFRQEGPPARWRDRPQAAPGMRSQPQEGLDEHRPVRARADLRLDLREPFPFTDSSVAVIYSEHFFEHLTYPGEVGHLLRESLRVLQPGGLFSVGVPDTEPTLKAYVHGDVESFRVCRERWHPSWCDTPMHQVNYHFRQGTEHKYAYDFETLARILETAGFSAIARRAFDPSLDCEARRDGTLYVDAKKPASSSDQRRRPAVSFNRSTP